MENQVDAVGMKKVWAIADCIVSPLGLTTEENYSKIKAGISGVHSVDMGFQEKICAGRFSHAYETSTLSHFENICSLALRSILEVASPDRSKTLFILSTTKGNIDFLEQGRTAHDRIHLHSTASFLADQFKFSRYMVVANACISGVLAIIVAKRYIECGKFDHVIVVGADVLSEFVISGFRSLFALSNEPCKPFDKHRKGINLGEGAGVMLLTGNPQEFNLKPFIQITGAAVSNDANHISGPSRTGEELFIAIQRALSSAGITSREIDFISAHGTATVFNDEMEAKAFSLAGLDEVPLHSLKGYYGHTLGAAGIIETIIAAQALRSDMAIRTLGYESHGVSTPVNVCSKTESRSLRRILKTASGFGGCNAALVLEK
jgi:3-oxoacyl-[acyl-carrier-protein] synthase I